MSPEQRAQEYADLFTRIGDRWRSCVPIQGRPHRARDEMRLDGVRIAKRHGADRWSVVSRPDGGDRDD